jgi:hypothetical protein
MVGVSPVPPPFYRSRWVISPTTGLSLPLGQFAQFRPDWGILRPAGRLLLPVWGLATAPVLTLEPITYNRASPSENLARGLLKQISGG